MVLATELCRRPPTLPKYADALIDSGIGTTENPDNWRLSSNVRYVPHNFCSDEHLFPTTTLIPFTPAPDGKLTISICLLVQLLQLRLHKLKMAAG
jgi:hypothetical protein